MRWSLITAVNSRTLLASCLLGSPDVRSADNVIIQEGYKSAAAAYNAGIDSTASEILVFCHQDIFLPPGWVEAVFKSVSWLEKNDPQWGVLGVFGINKNGGPTGHIYCTGLGRVLGRAVKNPEVVQSLDEIVLIVRRDSGLRFDASLVGFHLYGTDICLAASERSMNCYVIPAFCVHNTQGMKYLPQSFSDGYRYLQAKWRKRLPIKTPCTLITWSGFPLLEHRIRSFYSHSLLRRPLRNRVESPAVLYASLLAGGTLT